jgi:predicted CoA-binding protein
MKLPPSIAEFLAGKRLAVAGVSRDPKQTANFIYRKLRDSGYEVVPVNPSAAEVEGARCYPDLASVPGSLDGLVVVTPPGAGVDLVRQCAEKGVPRVWFHRALGAGSLSRDAVRECEAHGITCIAGGCPYLYLEPVDPAHRCMRWILGWTGQLPR